MCIGTVFVCVSVKMDVQLISHNQSVAIEVELLNFNRNNFK